jgi:hypothetical protein
VTGEVKKKKKLGGAYPGQMGQQHAPYAPPASAFQNGQATAHFVSYGGGNALTLVQPDGSTAPQHGGSESKYVQVTLPDGVESGQKIHVQAPDGRVNEIIIPPGFGPGMSFTIEFAPEHEAPPVNPYTKIPAEQAAVINDTRPAHGGYSSSAPPPPANSGVDDGFASGFNNPNWRPPPQQPAYASAHTDPEIDLSSYPTSQAVPVSNYPPPPKY